MLSVLSSSCKMAGTAPDKVPTCAVSILVVPVYKALFCICTSCCAVEVHEANLLWYIWHVSLFVAEHSMLIKVRG